MRKRFAAGLLTSAMMVSVLAGNVFATEPSGFLIDEDNFPDPGFRQYVSDEFDKDNDGCLSDEEVEAVTYIAIDNRDDILDLQGIMLFYNLEYFSADYTDNLGYVDLSHNKKLKEVGISYSEIYQINVRGCSELYKLFLYKTPVSKIDVTTNPKLEKLDVSGTQIQKLNIMYNPLLQTIQKDSSIRYVGNNWENYCNEHVDIVEYNNGSQYFSYDLSIEDNVISTCPSGLIDINSDVFPNTSLRNALVDWDVDGDILFTQEEINAVTGLFIDSVDDSVHGIDGLEMFINLEYLAVENTCITSFDASKFPKLKELYLINNNNLTSVNVSSNPNLEELSIYHSKVSTIDISKNTKLHCLDVSETNVTSLDLTNNPSLINAYRNGVKSEYSSEYADYYEYKTDNEYLSFDKGTELILEKPVTPATPTTPVPQQTPETGVAGFVERLYTVALGRASEPNGKAAWIAAIRRGESGAEVAKGFLFSDEFLNKNMSNADFVTVLYKTFFDRQPDAAGHAAWVAALERGESKQDVIMGFINSTEWANVCVRYGIISGGTGTANITVEPNADVLAFATRLYTTCLKRTPDQNGLRAWALQLANLRDTGTNASHGFFFSDEMNNNPVSNEEFVTRLYLTFMDRNPDTAGFNAWVGQLNSGVSREEVFQGFAQSNEFGEICARYGIIR